MTSISSRLKQPQYLLNHILEQPELPAIIKGLDADVLTKLIRHIGLEDSAEIVSMTTGGHLKGVLDEDLWHGEAPGRNDIFDAERFGLWLEILLESGPAFAVNRLMALDEDLIVLGLCRLVRVVNMTDLAFGIQRGRGRFQGDMLDKVLDGAFSLELDAHLVIARSQSRWEAVQKLLVELNESDDATLGRLLKRCSRISWKNIEDNGGRYHLLDHED